MSGFTRYYAPTTDYDEWKYRYFETLVSSGYIEDEDEYRSISGNLFSYDQTDYFNHEFNILIIDGTATYLKRYNYSGLPEHCCIFRNSYYFSSLKHNIEMDENELVYKVFSQDTPYIRSCDPGSQIIYAGFCDKTYNEFCVNLIDHEPHMTDEYLFYLKNICKTWARSIYARSGVPPEVDPTQAFTEKCTQDMNNPFCIDWILGIRDTNDGNLNAIADNILYAQPNIADYKCINVPKSIRNMANQHSTPYECWYAPCTQEPREKLTWENLKNRNLCRVTNCNITIDNLNISDKTQIDILCNNVEQLDKEEQKKNKELEIENTQFPTFKWTFLIFVIIIFVIYVTLSIIDYYKKEISDIKNTRIIRF